MRFVIFLFLLTCLMCYGSTGGNSNEEKNVYSRPLQGSIRTPMLRRKRSIHDTYGGEKERNPEDPKYKEIIEDVVYHHVGLKKENAKKITVTKITTQVSGIKIKNEFKVDLKDGKTMGCRSEIWEKLELRAKRVTYQCNELDNNKNKKHEKCISIAKESVEKRFKNLLDDLTVVDMSIRDTTFVETRIRRDKIMYINIDVVNKHFNGMESIIKCSVIFDIYKPDVIDSNCYINDDDRPNPLSVDCFEDPIEHHKGAEVWADPSESKYLHLAKKALLTYTEFDKPEQYDIIVTSVTHKVSWQRNKIEFIARLGETDAGIVYKCSSVVWAKLSGEETERIKCEKHK